MRLQKGKTVAKLVVGKILVVDVELVNCVVGGFVRAVRGTICLKLECGETFVGFYVPTLEPPAT